MQFGTQSTAISGPRLQTSIVPQVKEFNSEFPTSKIQCSIGGQTVTLYAMKGIPVIFTGFFRNLDATVNLSSLIDNISASGRLLRQVMQIITPTMQTKVEQHPQLDIGLRYQEKDTFNSTTIQIIYQGFKSDPQTSRNSPLSSS